MIRSPGPDIVLIMCPPWGVENPPLGPAYLAANLKECGLSAYIYDVNLHIYRWVGREHRKLWLLENDWKWRKPDNVKATMSSWKGKVDEVVEDLVVHPVDFLGFTVVDPNEIFTCNIIKRIKDRAPGKKIIAGGPACFSRGQREFLQNSTKGGIDYFIVGEAENSLPRLISDLKGGEDPAEIAGLVVAGGNLEPEIEAQRPDIGTIPFPTYEEFDLSAYGRESIALIWSRGCVGNCLFCKERSLWGNYRTRPVSSILEELMWHRDHTGYSNFVVYDSAVNGKHRHIEEICDAIIHSPLDITWSAEAIPLPTLTRARLHKMRAAGCHTLVFGVESGSDSVLEAMNKPFRISTVRKVIRDADYAGIKVAVNILVGFPGEGEAEFDQTLEFLRNNVGSIDRVDAISNLQVVDGTPLEEMSEGLGMVFPDVEPSNRWYTEDGNDLELRLDRVRRVRELARDLGVDVGRTVISGPSDKAPLKFRTKPVQLLRTLTRSIRNPSGLFEYGTELMRKKLRRILGEQGVVSEISPGDGLVFEGIYEGSKAFSAPQIVHLDLTNSCNLNCIACWDRSPLLGEDRLSPEQSEQTLSLEAVTHFIDDLVTMGGVREIRLGGGGEPSMHPDFPDIIHYIKSRPWNVNLEINTNFTMIDDHIAESLVRDEVDSVMASLWAGDGGTYERTHPGQTADSFDRIVDRLRNLADMSKSGKPILIAHNVLMNLNYTGIEEMVDLALDIGIDEISFVFIDPVHGKTDSLLMSQVEMSRLGVLLDRIGSRVDQFGIYRSPKNGKTVRITNFNDLKRRCRETDAEKGTYDRHLVDRIPCYIGWLFVRVMADGSVVPCCKGHRMKMGNILERDFGEIWNSNEYCQFRSNALRLPKSDPHFSLMGSGGAADTGCGNCDNIMHNLVCHRKILSRSSLLKWVRFEVGQKRTRG